MGGWIISKGSTMKKYSRHNLSILAGILLIVFAYRLDLWS